MQSAFIRTSFKSFKIPCSIHKCVWGFTNCNLMGKYKWLWDLFCKYEFRWLVWLWHLLENMHHHCIIEAPQGRFRYPSWGICCIYTVEGVTHMCGAKGQSYWCVHRLTCLKLFKVPNYWTFHCLLNGGKIVLPYNCFGEKKTFGPSAVLIKIPCSVWYWTSVLSA